MDREHNIRHLVITECPVEDKANAECLVGVVAINQIVDMLKVTPTPSLLSPSYAYAHSLAYPPASPPRCLTDCLSV